VAEVAVPPLAAAPVVGLRDRAALTLSQTLVWMGFLVGTVLLVWSYSYAATHDRGHVHLGLFVAGLAVFVVPAFVRLTAADASRDERLAIVAALGLFFFVPKFLRDPTMPLFFDELGHWRQAQEVQATGTLFQANGIVRIAQFFPGLHALTAALQNLSGLSTFQVDVTLVALLHVIGLFGIWVLAQSLWHSDRVAAVAAGLYALNPSFMFFHSQFAYESLAIVFLIWTLAAVASAQAAEDDRAVRLGWFAVALMLAAACIVTHHLSSYMLVGILLVTTAVTAVRARRGSERKDNAWLTGGFTLVVAAGAAAWMLLIASDTFAYLSANVTGGVREVVKLIAHEHSARRLFLGSSAPLYERISAFVAPAIVASAAVWGVVLLRRSRTRCSSVGLAVAGVGLLYLPSAAFLFSQAGNEGARRSWSFTFIGLSLLGARAAVSLRQSAAGRPRLARGARVLALCAAVVIVMVGDNAAGVNDEYRFPGPYVYGSDVRSLTAELLDTTRWFARVYGPRRQLIADRSTGTAFTAFGHEDLAVPYAGLPVWRLFFSARLPDAPLLRRLARAGEEYLVIDRRMATQTPRIGFYFDPAEPLAFRRDVPLPLAAITKYDRLPWTIKVFQSDNLAIYRLNFAALAEQPATQLSGRGR